MNPKPSARSTDDTTAKFIEHLRTLVESVFPVARSIHILLTVRRQPELLASLYAQRSRRIEGAGQSDFEFQLDHLIEPGFTPRPLNFYSLSSSLQAALDAQSVVLLPLEQMGSQAYRAALGDMLNICTPPDSDFLVPLNQRSVDGSKWLLQDVDEQLRFSHSFRKARIRSKEGSPSTIELSQEQTATILRRAREANASAQAFSPIGLAGYV